MEGATYMGIKGGVIASLLASRAVDRGFESRSKSYQTIKLVYVASPISMQL